MANVIDVKIPVNDNIRRTKERTVYQVVDEIGLQAAETAFLDGATAGGNVASKAKVNDANGNQGVVKATELHIGATGSETQVTATGTQLNYCAVTTPGTAEASKALILGASKNVDEISVAPAGLKSDGVVISPLKWVDVDATAALLDGAGAATVIAGVAGDQYKIRDVKLVGGGTNFAAGGDRLIDLTDGTTVWTQIANADIETAPATTLPWGNTKVPFLTGTSNTASVDGADIKFVYSGGTTDHSATGSITFSVCLEKVA